MSPNEKPKSYSELAIGAIERYKRPLDIALAVFFLIMTAGSVAIIIHIETTELAVLTALENDMGARFEDRRVGVYMNFLIYLTGVLASIYDAVRS